MNKLTLGISPCPNDTFIFEAWLSGHSLASELPAVEFLDVQNLNEAAQQGRFDVVKVSCGNLAAIQDEYQILRAGGAMGYGCGPLLLQSTSAAFDPNVETWLPGANTTAALLFKHWCAGAKVRYALFDEVYRALLRGEAKQGVVIHEHRFTYERDHLHCVQDLGAFWESSMHSPIPLGVIVARKSLGATRIAAIESAIRASLRYAWERPQLISSFIREHAQETDPQVMEQHIRMFVNDFSADIGDEGQLALDHLIQLQKLASNLK